jgi:predicted aspartyl protease
MDGTLPDNSSPRIKIELYGLFGRQNPPTVLEAIVDTGFTGGISIPIMQALPLGLTLFSTATFTLADNSKENTFLCLGMARLENEDRSVVFSLTKGNDILVGTEFLAIFNAKLELDYQTRKYSIVVRPATQPKKLQERDTEPAQDQKTTAKPQA